MRWIASRRVTLRQCHVVYAALLTSVLVGAAACGEQLTERDRPAVAVLPCENLSLDSTDAYLAAGLHSEILLRLAKISGLTSIGRSSVEYFRDNPASLDEMAATLGVGFVGECSVRKEPAEERIRLTFQLLEPTGAQVWAESYDAALTASSLLEIEREIAQQVAAAIGTTLLPKEQIRIQERPTENFEAYELYLRGIVLRDRGSVYAAAKLFQKAVELDPDFAEAHAYVSMLHSNFYHFSIDRSPDRLTLGRKHAERALHLDPESPEAHRALGRFYYVSHDYGRALEEYQQALNAQPDGQTVRDIASLYRRRGEFEEALRLYRRAAQLEPLSNRTTWAIASTLEWLRRYPEAEQLYRQALSSAPEDPNTYILLARLYGSWDGNTERAWPVLQTAREAGVEEERLDWEMAQLEIADQDYEAALSRLASLSQVRGEYGRPIPCERGMVYRLQGDLERARVNFDSARVELEERLRESPDDPRFTSELGYVYAYLGRKEDAIREGERGVALLPIEMDALAGYGRVSYLAHIYALVGEFDAAVDQLEILLSNPGYYTVPSILSNPVFDPLRDLPRFQALLEEYED